MTQKSHPDDLDSETLLLFITLHCRRPQDKYQGNQPRIVFIGMKKHTKGLRVQGSLFRVTFLPLVLTAVTSSMINVLKLSSSHLALEQNLEFCMQLYI